MNVREFEKKQTFLTRMNNTSIWIKKTTIDIAFNFFKIKLDYASGRQNGVPPASSAIEGTASIVTVTSC